jgi:hypothetical protein
MREDMTRWYNKRETWGRTWRDERRREKIRAGMIGWGEYIYIPIYATCFSLFVICCTLSFCMCNTWYCHVYMHMCVYLCVLQCFVIHFLCCFVYSIHTCVCDAYLNVCTYTNCVVVADIGYIHRVLCAFYVVMCIRYVVWVWICLRGVHIHLCVECFVHTCLILSRVWRASIPPTVVLRGATVGQSSVWGAAYSREACGDERFMCKSNRMWYAWSVIFGMLCCVFVCYVYIGMSISALGRLVCFVQSVNSVHSKGSWSWRGTCVMESVLSVLNVW